MALIILMCFMTLLSYIVLGDVSDDNPNAGSGGGTSNAEEANLGSSRNFSQLLRGFMPGVEEEFPNTKHGKVRRTRATGKQVSLPADVVRQMEGVPLSDLAGCLPENQKAIIEEHNRYRCGVSPPPGNMLKLKWKEKAQKSALAYAKKCIEEHSPITQRTLQDPEMTCGENLFVSNYKLPWSYVIGFWYGECIDFEYGKGKKSADVVIGHCLQVVWAASQMMGCDVAECENMRFKYIYVCHYCPAGNRGNKNLPYKKGTPCADCPKNCDGGLCTNACPVENKYKDCDDTNTNNACVTDKSMVSDCPATCKCTNGEIR